MTGLVVSSHDLVLFSHDTRSSFGAHHDFVLGPLEAVRIDLLVLHSGSTDCGLVDEVFKVSSRHSTGGSSQVGSVNISCDGHVLHVVLENLNAAANVREGN